MPHGLARLVVLLGTLFVTTAGAAPLVIEGEVPEDGGAFFTVPFTVTRGTVEISVRHDDLSSSTILDWGLRDPTNDFRGWGGGNSEPIVIGRTAASRSYLAGPLETGQWKVLVGKAQISSRPAKYRLEVELRISSTLSAQDRSPYTPASPLDTTARWYSGRSGEGRSAAASATAARGRSGRASPCMRRSAGRTNTSNETSEDTG